MTCPGAAGGRGQPGRDRRRETLLFYDHYDVQPPEPLDLWESPPFEPTLRGGKLFARGVADNKGNFVSRLAAVKAWLDVTGRSPVSVKFFLEGEEEIGSPHLAAFVDSHRDLLAADACIWESGGVNWQGQPVITLGLKGILYVELEARGATRDIHSAQATTVVNPAWRLVWALATLKDAGREHPDRRLLRPRAPALRRRTWRLPAGCPPTRRRPRRAWGSTATCWACRVWTFA